MEQQPKQNEGTSINAEHIINSLASQVADKSVEIAQKDAVIILLEQKISNLEKDVKNLQEELKKNAK